MLYECLQKKRSAEVKHRRIYPQFYSGSRDFTQVDPGIF